MGSRPIVRELDPRWDKVHRALMLKIAYLERELLDLHEDYLDLEQRCNVLMGAIRRQALRDGIERANRQAKAVNDG